MQNDWFSILPFAFLLMLIGSAWGAVVLARKLVNETALRILLGLLLFGVFGVAGTTAIIAGCAAITGAHV